MNLVKTCWFVLLLLSIHCVCGATYRDKLRIKRLTQNDQIGTKVNDSESYFSTQSVSQVTGITKLPNVEFTPGTETNENKTTFSLNKKSITAESVSVKTNSASDLQIPVQVIHDPTPEKQVSQRRPHPNIRPNGQRYRKIRRRKPQNNKFDKSKSQPISTSERPIITTETINAAEITTHAPLKSGRKLEISQINPNTVKKTRERKPVVRIIDSENQVYSHKGEFHYSYESGDGTKAFERSQPTKINSVDPSNSTVVGGFSYTDKEGNDFSLSYTADENGYRPVGAHLPTPPPIPPAIARALAYLATKPTPDPDSVTGKYFVDY